MTPEAMAAWVQAIGSIGAIFAAFLVSSKQFRHAVHLQETQAKAEMKRRYEVITALVQTALKEFGDAHAALRGTNPDEWFDRHSALEMMDDLAQVFAQVSPLDLPSARAVQAVLTARDRLKTAAWNARAALEHGTSSYEAYIECVSAMESNLNDVRDEQIALLAEMVRSSRTEA